jgi:uncharacterized protein (TIGR03067 family)
MRARTPVIVMALMLCVVGSAFAAGPQGEEAKKELQKFQGTWVMVAGEWDGKKVADGDAAKSKITYEGNKITVITPHQNKEPIVAELVETDTTKSPRQMTFVRKNGPSAGKTIVAIYAFDGNDLYHFAFDPTGATVPKELSAKEKSGHIKHTWKRLK